MSTSKHPKGLYLIFATSTAERFSYYGMRAIFILFLTQALLFDKEHAASGSSGAALMETIRKCGWRGSCTQARAWRRHSHRD